MSTPKYVVFNGYNFHRRRLWNISAGKTLLLCHFLWKKAFTISFLELTFGICAWKHHFQEDIGKVWKKIILRHKRKQTFRWREERINRDEESVFPIIWTNVIYEEYILWFEQIELAIWANTFCNLWFKKYICKF